MVLLVSCAWRGKIEGRMASAVFGRRWDSYRKTVRGILVIESVVKVVSRSCKDRRLLGL